MDTVLTIVVGLLVLTVLVVAHEAGHFFVGRACNIRIDEFSVGFGLPAAGWVCAVLR